MAHDHPGEPRAPCGEERQSMVLVQPPELPERHGSCVAGEAQLGQPTGELEGLLLCESPIAVA